MKGLRLYLILFAALAALAMYLYLHGRSGSYSSSGHEFAVRDTASIESILMQGSPGETLLSREGDRWLVNGQPARKESVDGLLVLISRLEVESPVSRSLGERLLGALESESTRVSIFMKHGKEKAYRVYYDGQSNATYMRLKGEDAAFRVSVRGYRSANLEDLFTADSRFWRDNVMFQAMPGDISRVVLQNNGLPGQSFHLARNQAGRFEVAAGIIPGSWLPADPENLVQYLGYFHDVRFESFLDPARDTLMRSEEPQYVLSVELVSGQRTEVKFFTIYQLGDAGALSKDLDRMYARIVQGDEWVVIKYVQVDPLFKEYKYFAGP